MILVKLSRSFTALRNSSISLDYDHLARGLIGEVLYLIDYGHLTEVVALRDFKLHPLCPFKKAGRC